MTISGKIELKAYMRPGGSIVIVDQDDREFNAQPTSYGHRGDSVVEMGVELSMPNWPLELPRVEIRFSIPLIVANPQDEKRLAQILGKID